MSTSIWEDAAKSVHWYREPGRRDRYRSCTVRSMVSGRYDERLLQRS